MNLNQVFELSTVLDNEHFQKIFARSYNGEYYIDEDDGEYIDHLLSNKGITVIYRGSQYKKKIRLIVNTYLLLDDVFDTDKLVRKLDKRIAKYFDHKHHLEDFVLSGMNFTADIDVDTAANVQSYLNVIKRIGKVKGFSPVSYECFDDNSSFCLSGNSNNIDFLLYDLAEAVMHQHRDSNHKKFKIIKNIHCKNNNICYCCTNNRLNNLQSDVISSEIASNRNTFFSFIRLIACHFRH